MTIRYLLDENLSRRILIAALRMHPHLDILRVGDPDCPPLQSPDDVILAYVAENRRVLVTRNRTSMPAHVERLKGRGLQHWGILQVKPDTTYRQLVEALLLFNDVSEPEGWIGKTVWIPY